ALEQASTACAQALVRAGVRPGDRVALCLTRTPLLAVSLLGVWKAGGCVVFLDPGYPAARLVYAIEDSGAPPGVVGAGASRSLPTGCEVLEAESLARRVVEGAGDLPEVDASSAACLFYTSGSTGQPKGVPMTHGALVNYGLSMVETLALSSADRVLQL